MTVPKLILGEFALSCAGGGVVVDEELPLLGIGPMLVVTPMQPAIPITAAKPSTPERHLYDEPSSFTF
jgi:hypothetical protein